MYYKSAKTFTGTWVLRWKGCVHEWPKLPCFEYQNISQQQQQQVWKSFYVCYGNRNRVCVLPTDILVFYQFHSINLIKCNKRYICLLVPYIYINDILEYTFIKKQQHVTKTNIAMATNI